MSMLGTIILAAVTGAPPLPPGKTIVVPETASSAPFVEQSVDHGDTVDLIIRCAKGTAVISFSKALRQFCAREHDCAPTLSEAAARGCG